MARANAWPGRIPRASRSLNDAAQQSAIFYSHREDPAYPGNSPGERSKPVDPGRWLAHDSRAENKRRWRSHLANRLQREGLDVRNRSRNRAHHHGRSRHLSRSRLWPEQSRNPREPEQTGLLVSHRIPRAEIRARTPPHPDLRRHQLPGSRVAQRPATRLDQRSIHPRRLRCNQRHKVRQSERSRCAHLAASSSRNSAGTIRQGWPRRKRRHHVSRRSHLRRHRRLGLDSRRPRPRHRHLATGHADRNQHREDWRRASRDFPASARHIARRRRDHCAAGERFDFARDWNLEGLLRRHRRDQTSHVVSGQEFGEIGAL